MQQKGVFFHGDSFEELHHLWDIQSNLMHTEHVYSPISTGILRLDFSLNGGFPSGITQIYGPDSVGKTGLIGQVLASVQKQGYVCILFCIDYLDILYLQCLGVECASLIVTSNFDSLVEILSFFRDRNIKVGLAVDSMSDYNLCRFEPIFTSIHNYMGWGSFIIYASQVRARTLHRFSSRVKSASNRLLDRLDCVLELSRSDIKNHGFQQIINIVKLTTGTPGKVLSLPFVKGKGIAKKLDLIRLGKENGVISVRGPSLYFEDKFLGRGEVEASNQLDVQTEFRLSEIIGCSLQNS